MAVCLPDLTAARRSRARLLPLLAVGVSLLGPGAAADPPEGLHAGAGALGAALRQHGGRVMLVHFWATWCAPCEGELRSLSAFYEGAYRELVPRGLVLLTVSNDVRPRDLERFLARRRPPFPVLFDSLSALNEQLDLVGLPGTVVIDREGRVVDRMIGVQDWQSPEFLARLESYLAP